MIRQEINGIELQLEEHCGYCPDFETEVEKIDMTTLAEPYRRVATVIRCRNASRCHQLMERLKEKANE